MLLDILSNVAYITCFVLRQIITRKSITTKKRYAVHAYTYFYVNVIRDVIFM